MGLGKTLSVLALICSSLDFHAEIEELAENKAYQRTLIVAPKSSGFAVVCSVFLIY